MNYCGYQVLEAPDVVEDLRVFQSITERMGIVKLDIVMPGMSGWDVLARLKEIAPTSPSCW